MRRVIVDVEARAVYVVFGADKYRLSVYSGRLHTGGSGHSRDERRRMWRVHPYDLHALRAAIGRPVRQSAPASPASGDPASASS